MSSGAGGGVGVFVKLNNLAVADGPGVGEVAAKFAAVNYDAPLVAAEADNPVAFGDQLAWFEFQRLLQRADGGKEIRRRSRGKFAYLRKERLPFRATST